MTMEGNGTPEPHHVVEDPASPTKEHEANKTTHLVITAGRTVTWLLTAYIVGKMNFGNLTGLFQYHPILIAVAFFVLLPESYLSARRVRASRGAERKALVLRHVWTSSLFMIFGFFGAAAVWWNKIQAGKVHFTSWHSWSGLGALAVMAVQAALGILLYWKLLGARKLIVVRRNHVRIPPVLVVFGFLACIVGFESNFVRGHIPNEIVRRAFEGVMVGSAAAVYFGYQ